MAKRIRQLTAVQAMKLQVRNAEAQDLAKKDNATGANGFLLLKFREPKIGRLVSNKKIGQVELQACDEITAVYEHLCSGLWLRGNNVGERVDRGMRGDPPWFLEAYHDRYLPWARSWAKRKITHRDPTAKIVYDYLFSDISGADIDSENGWAHGTAVKVFIHGVRDYAAMAGWVDRGTAASWSSSARALFPRRPEADLASPLILRTN